MSDRKPRRPAAFRLDDPSVRVELSKPSDPGEGVDAARSEESPEAGAATLSPREFRRTGWRIGRLFLAASFALISLAVGLWVTDFVSGLFARAAWLGWTGLVIAALAGLAFIALLSREITGLIRLRRITHLRAAANEAAVLDDRQAAREIARRIISLYAFRPETARGRANLETHISEIIDGRDLLRLAERELMTPLDLQARALVTTSAQRVSVVTAISPRAIVDMLFVAFEGLRLIRRMGALYGGRPSGLAMVRLTRLALGHLAITGGLAMTDSLVHQMVGQGLAARLSARLGEGVINGMMTARIGLAALDVCRPLPWLANQQPGLRDVMSTLAGTGKTGNRAKAT